MSIPRGIRNNNPGNIRHGQNWQGLAKEQTDNAFDQFVSPEYGIRAIAKILFSYQNRGLESIRKMINAWAPTNENDTEAYVEAVCASSGLDADACLDMTNEAVVAALVKAIVMHENGQQPYSDEIVNKGVHMAYTL